MEIDIFCEKPVFVAAKLTWTLGSGVFSESAEKAVEKSKKFITKVDFLEHRFGKPPLAFFVCAADIDGNVHSALKNCLDEHKIRLIHFDGERLTLK